jgi:hypothetical protein
LTAGHECRARSVRIAELAEGMEAIQSGLAVLHGQVKTGRIDQSYEYDLFALYVQLVNLRERLVADEVAKTKQERG